MRNFKLFFLPFCFLCCFATAKGNSNLINESDAQTEQSKLFNVTEKEPASKDDSTTFTSARDIEAVDQAEEKLFLSSFSSSEELKTNRFLEFGLEYPTSFGINLRYLLTDSVYVRFGLGFMSKFFLESFEKIADSFGYLKEEEAKLLSDTLQNSMYMDFRLAWAPYLKSKGGGPYLELGLSHSLFGKGELNGVNLSRVLNDNSFGVEKYSAKTNTYNANFHVGYQIPFEKVKLNFEIGLIKILYTELLDETSLTAPKTFSDSQKKKFQAFLKQKGWIFPTFSGWISFAF